MNLSSQRPDNGSDEIVDWADLGMRMWNFLTGREAAINYEFRNMVVEVPRDTGSNAPRATWRVDGLLRVTTDDNADLRSA